MAKRRRKTAQRSLALLLMVACAVALVIYLTRCGGSTSISSAVSTVRINEVMSSNKGSVPDETGDFPDWVEIHNNTDAAVDISGFGLSDDLLSAAKWTFPSNTVVEANGFVVVFCSGDATRGSMHTPFRLSASDDVILTSVSGSVLDSIKLRAVETGMTLALDPADNATWTSMQPSPGYPNTAEGIAAFLQTQSADATESIGVFINEFMASNASTIVGPDGSYCDWIELYNTTEKTIDLSGYGISDSVSQPLKYTLPQGTSIEPYGVLLIFCTGRETPEGATQIEAPFGLAAYQEAVVFSTPQGRILDSYEYSRAESDISFARTPDGTGEFGKNAQPSPGYVNTNAGLQAFMATLSYGKGDIIISEALNANYSTLQQPGPEYYDWVEIHNNTAAPIPLAGYALSNNAKNPAKWVFPDITLEAGEYLAVLASGRNVTDAQKKNNLETNFGLSGDGEVVLLFSPQGEILDKLQVPRAHADVSYGRSNGALLFYQTPTPNEANGSGAAAYVDTPKIDLAPGCYEGTQTVNVSVMEGATATYTVDGTEPTQSSTPVTGAITVSKTTPLRVRAFSGGLYDSDVATASYIIYTGESTVQNHRHDLPVISLVTAPDNLFDPVTGIYVVGTKVAGQAPDEDENAYVLAGGMNQSYAVDSNFWRDWERPVHFDLIGESGASEYSADCMIRIFGAFSRNKEQKGLTLIARPGYGNTMLNHAFFDDRPYTSYKSVILRASAQDATFSRIRDIVITSLLGENTLGLEPESQIYVQAYRQMVVYINGQYWGVYNMREKITKYFLSQHYGVADPDSIDILMGNGNEKCIIAGAPGAYKEYLAMVEWADTHDMTQASNYEYIRSLMDVDNFAAYCAAEVVVGNTDTGNIKYWRTKELDNRWRWLFYDFCWGMNRNDDNSDTATSGYRRDFFSRYFHEQGHGAGKATSTELSRALLKNADFRALFLSKVAIMLNEVYTPEKIIARVDECQAAISEEMKFDVDLWKDISYTSWQQHCDNIRDYARNYQDYCLKYCQNYFSLSDSDMETIFGRKTSLSE